MDRPTTFATTQTPQPLGRHPSHLTPPIWIANASCNLCIGKPRAFTRQNPLRVCETARRVNGRDKRGDTVCYGSHWVVSLGGISSSCQKPRFQRSRNRIVANAIRRQLDCHRRKPLVMSPQRTVAVEWIFHQTLDFPT